MNIFPGSLLLLLILVLKRPWIASASLGNSFPTYKTCVEICRMDLCDKAGYYYSKRDLIPLPLLLLWKCSDDCQYRCMWGVVRLFENKGWPSPQFHGKWPFIRFLGVQEPASALFSIMNCCMHIKMMVSWLKKYESNVPMFKIWICYGLISINGWLWSTIFHTRDTPFTELMDYLSAFAIVFSGAYAMGMRILIGARKRYSVIYTVVCFLFFFNHALYLSSGPFDYGYNLFANVFVGVLSAALSGILLLKNRHLPHCKNLFIAVFALLCCMYFEIHDFPPYMWVLDAHALWHLCTCPAIYFFWRFVIDDTRYLQRTQTYNKL
ncbi:post-GPI attachment to proteins factor 3 [Cimex lectularius]|uniref:Post-GPI attachment to proteins factor 3 n=1 Tax=Cimex lectularius TaxID=79782 RepID=A0A8I6RYD7_CIMLE|nr:post-GPI attachment to proteins factor 3 [Cimex lectularius]XP_014254651.1 post-GPI attachment to proteins factor 3 [Cimex lectularius]